MPIQALDPIQIEPWMAALPKADLHLHQEARPRLERLAARRRGQPPFDWETAARQVLATPPGMGRLSAIFEPDAALDLTGAPPPPEDLIARVVDILEEAAADGALLVEVRFGPSEAPSPSELMPFFREAERRVRRRYPQLVAEAIGYVSLAAEPAKQVDAQRRLEECLEAAREGLAGIDLRIDPYDGEADADLWAIAYRWAERAAEAGLGVTVHAGEFSAANLAAALRTPGLKRIGHAVYAASDARLLEQLAASGATVECCLTSNVILGAVPSLESHPLRRFLAHGIPVTLNTDLPVHLGTTIEREYEIASALSFSPAELWHFTQNAVQASFAPVERRTALLEELRRREEALISSKMEIAGSDEL